MLLASYVGTHSGYRGLGNILIRLRLSGIKESLHLKPYGGTALRASHSELVFEPTDGVDKYMPDGTCQPDSEGKLWCASSTGTDTLPSWSKRRAGKLGGVRFKRINFDDKTKWELTPIVDTDAESIALFFNRVEGSMYDWQAILGFIAKFIHDKADRRMCSEVVAEALNIPEASTIDPCKLQKIVKEIYAGYLVKQQEQSIKTSMLNIRQFFSGNKTNG